MGIRAKQGSKWGGRATAAFMVVFGLAFASLGVYAWWETRQTQGGWMPVVGGVTFCGMGLGLVWLAIAALRGEDREAARREELADRPWLLRDDWAAGRVTSGGRPATLGAWAITGFWNAIAIPAAVGVTLKALAGEIGWSAVAMVAMFPLVGLGLAAMAVRAGVRWRKFGQSTLELKTLPGVVGGAFRAVLHAGPGLGETRSLTVTLDCLRRITSGDSTREEMLWQRTTEIPRSRFAMAGGVSIPLSFTIPFECAASDISHSDDETVWRLGVEAEVHGVDYAESFEVPIYRTDESREDVTGDEELIESIQVPPPGLEGAMPRLGSKVRIRSWGMGGRELRFGMLRNPATSAMLLVFTGGFAGALWLLFEQGAPLFFRLFWCLAVFGLVLGFLLVTFGVTRVRVEPGRLQVRGGLFGIGRTRRWEAHEIDAIETTAGMQSGGRHYWRIRVRGGGRQVTAGTRIPDRREALALVDLIAGTVGVR